VRDNRPPSQARPFVCGMRQVRILPQFVRRKNRRGRSDTVFRRPEIDYILNIIC